MGNWQITAITIYCDAIDDETTLLVHGEGATECTGYRTYGKPSNEIDKLMKKKAKKLSRMLRCDGPECHRLTIYRDKLFDEDGKK